MTNYKFGLLGYPISHSLSPIIHHTALESFGVKGSYKLFPIPPLPEGTDDLNKILSAVRKGKLTGLNITIPHKQNILGMVDHLSPTALAVGAVNTVYLKDKHLIGDNTDVPGFLSPLNSSNIIDSNRQRTALVFGAGGSARAVVYGLAMEGWNIILASRRIRQAQELIQSMKSFFSDNVTVSAIQLSSAPVKNVLDECQLLVNTTPVGMYPKVHNSPWPTEIAFPPHLNVYDLIYNPLNTPLQKMAERSGAITINGLGMLVEQAALSFEIWTGKSPDRAVLYRAVNTKL